MVSSTGKINLLEILKNLRRVDPDSLVLNFVETDDPNLDDKGGRGNDSESNQSDDGSATLLEMKRKDLFVYSTYLPPGKHCIIVRDTGTKNYKKYQKTQYEYEEEKKDESKTNQDKNVLNNEK